MTLFAQPAAAEWEGLGAVETRLDDWIFLRRRGCAGRGRTNFAWRGLGGFGLEGHPQAIAASGAIVHYLRATSAIGVPAGGPSPELLGVRPTGAGLEHLDRIRYYEQQQALVLDHVTARNLELTEPAAGDDRSTTLLLLSIRPLR